VHSFPQYAVTEAISDRLFHGYNPFVSSGSVR
jgi:hypothetical protein